MPTQRPSYRRCCSHCARSYCPMRRSHCAQLATSNYYMYYFTTSL